MHFWAAPLTFMGRIYSAGANLKYHCYKARSTYGLTYIFSARYAFYLNGAQKNNKHKIKEKAGNRPKRRSNK